MKDPGLVNLEWARALLEGLMSAGLVELVLSPGSRNTPLVLAATLQPGLGCRVVLDERCAAFTALGLARGHGRPVALVATSGSAPAHWLPAVVEASEQGVPLLLLSADRPWELHGVGANQTTDQSGLFERHVRRRLLLPEAEAGRLDALRRLGRRAVAAALWPDPGPVHLNLPLREPLVPAGDPPPGRAVTERPLAQPCQMPPAELVMRLQPHLAAGPGVILAGDGLAGERAVLDLAEALGAPVLADPLSGLRFCGRASAHLIAHYHRLLADPEVAGALRPRWILQFGRLPLSAHLQRALRHWQPAQYWAVDPRGRWHDPLELGCEALPVDPGAFCHALLHQAPAREAPQWLDRWRHGLEALQDPPSEARLIRQLLEALPDHSLLWVGNSLPVRWLDAWSGHDARHIAVHGNRGVSGIDGQLSTFLGLCLSHRGSGRRLALVGDLTFQHDLGALANFDRVDATVVVIDNGGGGIFDGLPQRDLPGYRRYWRTPQAFDAVMAGAAFGMDAQRLETPEALGPALEKARTAGGARLLVVPWRAV